MGWDFIADSILMTMKRDLSTFVIRWDFIADFMVIY